MVHQSFASQPTPTIMLARAHTGCWRHWVGIWGGDTAGLPTRSPSFSLSLCVCICACVCEQPSPPPPTNPVMPPPSSWREGTAFRAQEPAAGSAGAAGLPPFEAPATEHTGLFVLSARFPPGFGNWLGGGCISSSIATSDRGKHAFI